MSATGAADAVVEVVEKVNLDLDRVEMEIEMSKEDLEVLRDLLG